MLASRRFCVLATPILSLLVASLGVRAAVLDPDDPLPLRSGAAESIPGVTTWYSSVEVAPGTRLRVLVTRPEESEGLLHPLFLTQWVSCGSLAYRPGSGTSEILAMLARHSGLSLVRVERSGSGDSTGVDCSELDYDTELEHYRKAFAHVIGSGAVDPSRLLFFGSSLGSTTAPLIARHFQERGYEIGGIAVQGGGAYSYLERMLAFEQHYLDRRPAATAGSNRTEAYQERVSFLLEYLVKGRHPDEIATDSAAMRAVRSDILGMDETHHYGRPYRWHQQAARYDFAAAWEALRAPVLVIYNAFDQYESRYGATLLAERVNASLAGGHASVVVQEALGHSSYRYRSAVDAYANEGGLGAWSITSGQLVTWFREHAGKS